MSTSCSIHDAYVSLDKSTNGNNSFEEKRINARLKMVARRLPAAVVRALERVSMGEETCRDIEVALRGDYDVHDIPRRRRNRRGNQREGERTSGCNMFLLPDHRQFEERLSSSNCDGLSLESNSRKYRFLSAFIIKAELCPGLAFGEVLLTWLHVLVCK